MRIPLDVPGLRAEVRSFAEADAVALARHADSREVWLGLRDAFPHPYTLEHARAFIAAARAAAPENRFAIAADDEAVGAIGFVLHADVERVSAEIGYWVAPALKGRGLATAAVRAVTAHAIAAHGLTRVYAVPYAWNTPSCRVLEKVGFVLEGRMRRSAIKDGRVIDQLLYAWVVPK